MIEHLRTEGKRDILRTGTRHTEGNSSSCSTFIIPDLHQNVDKILRLGPQTDAIVRHHGLIA